MQIFHILQKKISTKHCCNKWKMENFHFRPWKTVIFQLKKTDPVIASWLKCIKTAVAFLKQA